MYLLIGGILGDSCHSNDFRGSDAVPGGKNAISTFMRGQG